jgi:hypothetical protein
MYPEVNFDFVYIDGNHRYSYVFDDLTRWWPRVRQGGMLIGDDAFDNLDDPQRDQNGDVGIVWDTSRPNDISMYGVKKAFVDFADSKSLPVFFYASQAIIFKS